MAMIELFPPLPVFSAYALAVVVLALTPGPDMTLFLAKTIGQGRAAGFAAASGAFSGLLVHTVLVAIGLSAVLAASATAFTVLKIVGALYLAWLAIEAIRHGSGIVVGTARLPREPLGRVYLKGLLINLLNPKIIIFFITFLPQFVSPSDPYAAAKLLTLGASFIVIAAPVVAALILAAGVIGRHVAGSRRIGRALDWLFAMVMGGFAVKLALARAG
jgi:threonine/homoserine/homoserine lactone efflux protein